MQARSSVVFFIEVMNSSLSPGWLSFLFM
ncbi:hypothetical protein Nmel_003285 [Mimus melanotis]